MENKSSELSSSRAQDDKRINCTSLIDITCVEDSIRSKPLSNQAVGHTRLENTSDQCDKQINRYSPCSQTSSNDSKGHSQVQQNGFDHQPNDRIFSNDEQSMSLEQTRYTGQLQVVDFQLNTGQKRTQTCREDCKNVSNSDLEGTPLIDTNPFNKEDDGDKQQCNTTGRMGTGIPDAEHSTSIDILSVKQQKMKTDDNNDEVLQRQECSLDCLATEVKKEPTKYIDLTDDLQKLINACFSQGTSNHSQNRFLVRDTDTDVVTDTSDVLGEDDASSKSFHCKECATKFITMSELFDHMSARSKNVCTVCSKMFCKLEMLDKHVVTHSGGCLIKAEEARATASSLNPSEASSEHHESFSSVGMDIILEVNSEKSLPDHSGMSENNDAQRKGKLGVNTSLKEFSEASQRNLDAVGLSNKNSAEVAGEINTLSSFDQNAPSEEPDVTKLNPEESENKKSKANKMFECIHCGDIFKTKNEFVKHSQKHTEKLPHQCKDCMEGFLKASEYKEHCNKVHNNDRPFECLVCGKRLSSMGILKNHSGIHSGNRPFHCTACNKSFLTKTNLDDHLRKHVNAREFECQVCQKRFNLKGALRQHEKVHKEDKPFKCDYCSMAFPRGPSLWRHVRTHTGEKPYRCDICGKTFARVENCAEHRRIHTGQRPYVCKICNKTFRDSGNFSNHKKIHKEGYVPRKKSNRTKKDSGRAFNTKASSKKRSASQSQASSIETKFSTDESLFVISETLGLQMGGQEMVEQEIDRNRELTTYIVAPVGSDGQPTNNLIPISDGRQPIVQVGNLLLSLEMESALKQIVQQQQRSGNEVTLSLPDAKTLELVQESQMNNIDLETTTINLAETQSTFPVISVVDIPAQYTVSENTDLPKEITEVEQNQMELS